MKKENEPAAQRRKKRQPFTRRFAAVPLIKRIITRQLTRIPGSLKLAECPECNHIFKNSLFGRFPPAFLSSGMTFHIYTTILYE